MGLDDEARRRLATMDVTATIGGSFGRKLLGGFGGVTLILSHGDKIPD